MQATPNTTSIEVYSGLRVQRIPAPFLRRCLALVIDLSIISAAMYGVFIVLLLMGGMGAIALAPALKYDATSGAVAIGALILLVIVLLGIMGMSHAYFITQEFKKGSTIGKRLMGLSVVSIDGGALTLRQAVIRELARSYLDMLFLLPGLIAFALTKKRQRVGDMMAGTMVIFSKAASLSQTFVFVHREDYLAIRRALEPASDETEFQDRFLEWADRRYLREQGEALQAEEENWASEIRRRHPRTQALQLNNMTLLRFFAEHYRRRGIE